MANRTDQNALSVRGQNPQSLIEAILRQKIYSSRYWKENCMGLNAETIVDEAIKIEYIAGTYGGARKPSKFIILVLKLLQIAPDKDIILEYIKNKDYKYVTALAAFYLRLIGNGQEIYKTLEALLIDNRKLRFRNQDGTFKIIYMDEFIDSLLTNESLCDTNLPLIQKRNVLEDLGQLQPRVSILEQELEKELQMELEQEEKKKQQEAEQAQKSKEEAEAKDLEQKNNQEQQLNKQENNVNSKELKEGEDKKEKNRNHHHHHHHHRHHHKDKVDNQSGGSNWRAIVKGKYKNKEKSRSRSRNKQEKDESKEKVYEKDSIEYWNQIRQNLGISLLTSNDQKN